jgi:hypothetical protein
MLLYVEFISRRASVPLERFHAVAGRTQGTWAQRHGDDRIILNVGRTWRVGPEPEYLCVWYTPRSGLERIDDWQRLFRQAAVAEQHAEFEAVARIDRAGCYRPVTEPTEATEGRYLLEWLSCDGVSNEKLAAAFASREQRHPERTLRCLASPLGALAPGSHSFAAWGLAAFGDAQALARDLPDPDTGIAVVEAGLYADLGDEQL